MKICLRNTDNKYITSMSGDLELIKYFEHLYEKKDTITVVTYDKNTDEDIFTPYYVDAIVLKVYPHTSQRDETEYFVDVFVSECEDL